MKKPYTSKGIVEKFPAHTRALLVNFFPDSAPYNKHGSWVVGTLLEEDISSSVEEDFPVGIEITSAENAPNSYGIIGKTSFRGSEVRLIEAHG